MSDRKRTQRITRVTSWPLHPPPPHPVEAEAEAEAAWQRSPCLDATWGSIDLSALGWHKAWWGTSPWPTAARSLIASTQPAGPFPGQSQDNLVEGAAPWPDGGGHTVQARRLSPAPGARPAPPPPLPFHSGKGVWTRPQGQQQLQVLLSVRHALQEV